MIPETYGNATGMNIGDMIRYHAGSVYEVQYFVLLDFQYGAIKFYDIKKERITSMSAPYVKRYPHFFKRLS